MNVNDAVNLLKNQASTDVKEKILAQAKTNAAEGATGAVDETSSESVEGTTDTSEDFNTFLTLLTAQIKSQDPLAPLDSTQFVEQLATFSSVEMQAKTNVKLETIANLLKYQISLTNPDAVLE